jgi:hypothetical protein
MRRSTSRIGKLPGEVLEQVNEKLHSSWEYREIRKWLFEEVAVEDVPALGLLKGEKFGLVWLRAGKSTEHAYHHCELALGNWFRTWHGVWVREKLRRGDSMRTVKRAAALTLEAAAVDLDCPANDAARPRRSVALREEVSIAGGDVIMRSVLIDAISQVSSCGEASSFAKASSSAKATADEMADSPTAARVAGAREIAQLANAWARLNAGKMEEEKLRLKTEDARKAAFDEIGRDVRGNPEALELFKKLREVMEGAGKKVDPLTK